MYSEQTAVVRTEHGITEEFKIKKGLRQRCVLSPSLFNLYVTNTNCICPRYTGESTTYLVPVNYVVGVGVWHNNAYSIYQ